MSKRERDDFHSFMDDTLDPSKKSRRPLSWEEMSWEERGEQDGDYNVTRRSTYTFPDGSSVKIGSWLGHQRYEQKKGKMPPDR